MTETMLERVKQRFHIQPRRLAGDTTYGVSGAEVAGRPWLKRFYLGATGDHDADRLSVAR